MEPDRRTGVERRDVVRGCGGRRTSDRSRAIASRLSAELYRRQMTANRLAVLAAIDERTVRNVLDGKDATMHTLDAIAGALQMDLITLIALPEVRI
jgi:predicted transcriptional regulator